MKILTVVGNRPQFIKLGVVARALRAKPGGAKFQNVVVNTGQHYDEMLSDVFFNELEIEAPDYNLEIGSGHIVDQIGKMLAPIRIILETEEPDATLVFGDTNSTIAAALAAAHLAIPVIHVEGGERLYRRINMPEEVNRIVTDHLSSYCLASSRKAVEYLKREGFADKRIAFVGDPMYDIFKLAGRMLDERDALQPANIGLMSGHFGLCTIHRAENTDDRDICTGLLEALDQAPFPVVLPIHPRLRARLKEWSWQPASSLRLIDPLGYFDFQSLLRQSSVIITDSGGVGREAFFAQKPAIVPLESSAWIEPVEAGLATMTGQSPERLARALNNIPDPSEAFRSVEYNFGDGEAGEKIVDTIAEFLENTNGAEGVWHRLTSFENLPPATTSTQYSFDGFKRLLSSEARPILDISKSLLGLEELLSIANECGVSITLHLSTREAAYNFLGSQSRSLIERALAAGHALVSEDENASRLLATAFASEVAVLNIANLDEGAVLYPHRMADIGISSFESDMRAADHIGKTVLDNLSHELSAARNG